MILLVSESWGFFAHKKINELAIYLLPPDLFAIYRDDLSYLVEHSVDPDKRRYIDPEEGVRHYLDGEAWNLDSLPERWDSAVAKYGVDSVRKHGIVPWHINLMCFRLRSAFASRDLEKVLYLTAELGHYVGDLHVPLHTTSNYNGQLTEQHGIHALWETQIPEWHFDRMSEGFKFRGVEYFEDIQKEIWKVYRKSHSLVAEVLDSEMGLRHDFDSSKMMAYSERGMGLKVAFSERYVAAYNKKLKGMVAHRLVDSYHFLASLIYTCWVDGGQPTIELMRSKPIIKSDSARADSNGNRRFKIGRIFGREEPSH